MEVFFLEWDDENEEHLGEHGLTPELVRQVLSNRHMTMENPRKEERVLLIGETHGGTILTVSLEPTRDPGTWRPVTGWNATDAERKLFNRHCR